MLTCHDTLTIFITVVMCSYCRRCAAVSREYPTVYLFVSLFITDSLFYPQMTHFATKGLFVSLQMSYVDIVLVAG